MNQRRRRKSTGIKNSGAKIKTVSGGMVAVFTFSSFVIAVFFLFFALRANFKSEHFNHEIHLEQIARCMYVYVAMYR